ncbi:MAG: hypothetical protein IJK08_05790 [Prevotella sp.]|nr:hypothetical protein [Prevotella sp.]
MSKHKHEGHMVIGSAELRQGASRYVGALTGVLEQVVADDKPLHRTAKEMIQIGYAAGVVAGKLSDVGIEGFTLLLRGIELSMSVEERAERMQYAVWDKDGDLHTSDDMKKGGEQ